MIVKTVNKGTCISRASVNPTRMNSVTSEMFSIKVTWESSWEPPMTRWANTRKCYLITSMGTDCEQCLLSTCVSFLPRAGVRGQQVGLNTGKGWVECGSSSRSDVEGHWNVLMTLEAHFSLPAVWYTLLHYTSSTLSHYLPYLESTLITST